MKMNWAVVCATLGPVGHCYAPGTIATFVTIPLVWLIHWAMPILVGQIFVTSMVMMFSYSIIARAMHTLHRYDDPQEIVLDEVVGCLVTFTGISLDWFSLGLGILIFRFFDITKWFGIRMFEQLAGSWGVLADDIVAGLFANIILHAIGYGLA